MEQKDGEDGRPSGRRFVTPIYRGPRFENHRLPVDLVGDLVVYRDLVADVARELFRMRNPERKRLPKNFIARFQLSLGGVENGSAIPVLERTVPSPEVMIWSDEFDEFEEARDLIAETIDAVHSGRALPPAFPSKLFYRFNAFGSALRDEESIELLSPGASSGPRYDRNVRKRIVLAGSQTYEDRVDQVGFVIAVDRERKTFDLKPISGQRITCCLEPQFYNQIVEALGTSTQQIRLVGVGEFDAQERIRSVLKIHEMLFIGDDLELDMSVRLDELGRLPEGWLEGEGQSISREGLQRLTVVLDQLVNSKGLRPPFLYPTPDGQVRAEWSFKDHEVSATFDLANWEVWLHAAASRAEFSDELTVSTDDTAAISQFVWRFDDRRRTENG